MFSQLMISWKPSLGLGGKKDPKDKGQRLMGRDLDETEEMSSFDFSDKIKDDSIRTSLFARPVDSEASSCDLSCAEAENSRPTRWSGNPFHPGEVIAQKCLGVHETIMQYAPQKFLPYMLDPHRDFYGSLPFLVVAARDDTKDHNMWCTLLFASSLVQDRSKCDAAKATSFAVSPNPESLSLDAQPVWGDALEDSLQPGVDVGILGINLDTRARNKVNGRLIEPSSASSGSPGPALQFTVDQSFPHCPMFIKQRHWRVSQRQSEDTVSVQHQLSQNQMSKIAQAETIFLATGYRGEGEDARYGNDVAHRGGQSGAFIKIVSPTKIRLAEYLGNNHCNTVGNLELDPSTGVTIPLFETGGMIQMSGSSTVEWDAKKANAEFPGARQVIEFTIEKVVELCAGSLPIEWPKQSNEMLGLEVVEKVVESDDTVSLKLMPPQLVEGSDEGSVKTLPPFLPGQYVDLVIPVQGGGRKSTIRRCYSLSSSPSVHSEYYRISVKREEFGVGSRCLHDQVQENDVIRMSKPSGDFYYTWTTRRPLVLIGSGIGATPLLSMLYTYVECLGKVSKEAFWLYSARDGNHHPFREEVESLQGKSNGRLNTHIVYTRPEETDDSSRYNSTKRINAALVEQFVGLESLEKADVFICGSRKFCSDLHEALIDVGADPSQVHFEEF